MGFIIGFISGIIFTILFLILFSKAIFKYAAKRQLNNIMNSFGANLSRLNDMNQENPKEINHGF